MVQSKSQSFHITEDIAVETPHNHLAQLVRRDPIVGIPTALIEFDTRHIDAMIKALRTIQAQEKAVKHVAKPRRTRTALKLTA